MLKALLDIKALLGTGNEQRAQQSAQLNQIILLLTPPLPASMELTITNNQGETIMALSKSSRGKMKLDIHGDGTATASVSFQDNTGLPASLPAGATLSNPFSSSDAGIVVTPASDGMSATLAPTVPPQLVTGAVITAGPAVITLSDGSTINIDAVQSEPLNVVAGAPGKMKIVLA